MWAIRKSMKLREGFEQYPNVEVIVRNADDDFDDVAMGYGTDWFTLSESQLDRLREGHVLQVSENQWEYQMFIRLEKQ